LRVDKVIDLKAWCSFFGPPCIMSILCLRTSCPGVWWSSCVFYKSSDRSTAL